MRMVADLLVVAEIDRENSSDLMEQGVGPSSSSRDASRQAGTGVLAGPDTAGDDSDVPAQAQAVFTNTTTPSSMSSAC